MRRLALVFATIAAALIIPGASALAQSYQIDSLSTTSPTPGQTIHVHGNGFAPSSTVAVVQTCGGVTTTIGSLTASSDAGTVDGDVVLPASTPAGACSISLVGTNPNGSPRSLDFSVTVAGTQTAAAATSGALPFTGAWIAPLIAAAVASVMLGVALVTMVRRRRSHSIV